MPSLSSKIVGTLLLLSCAGSLSAQNPGRVLNGFHFLPSEQTPSPFVTSYIKTATGGGMALDLKTPFIDVDGDTLGVLEGDVAFMNLAFQYQQALGSRFALRVGLTGSARVGVDEQSILAQGLTGLVGFALGGTGRIWNNRQWLVSGSLDFARNQFVGLTPFEFAQSVIDSSGLTSDNDLVNTTNTTSGRASVRAAWAPKAWLGATAAVEGGVGDVKNLADKGIYGGSATLAVDFRNLGWWPVGVQGFFRFESFNQNGTDNDDRSSRFGLGVFYTGRDDFSVGMEGTSASFKQAESDAEFNAILLTFNIRYWFSGG